MGTCPDAIKRLIERFDQQLDQVRSPDYNETQLRIDFVNPLFAALGWDIDNRLGKAEQYREVVHDDKVKVAGQTKAPDYSFRIGGARKFFLEAKKPFVNLKVCNSQEDPAKSIAVVHAGDVLGREPYGRPPLNGSLKCVATRWRTRPGLSSMHQTL